MLLRHNWSRPILRWRRIQQGIKTNKSIVFHLLSVAMDLSRHCYIITTFRWWATPTLRQSLFVQKISINNAFKTILIPICFDKIFQTISFGDIRLFAIISSTFPKHIGEQFLWKTQLLMTVLQISVFILKTPTMKNGD